jgi:hypothetical protein
VAEAVDFGELHGDMLSRRERLALVLAEAAYLGATRTDLP